jgi:hypothetical protein
MQTCKDLCCIALHKQWSTWTQRAKEIPSEKKTCRCNTFIYKACKEVKMLHLETLKELNSNKSLSISRKGNVSIYLWWLLLYSGINSSYLTGFSLVQIRHVFVKKDVSLLYIQKIVNWTLILLSCEHLITSAGFPTQGMSSAHNITWALICNDSYCVT